LKYLYDKVAKKIDELMENEKGKAVSMESLKTNLPNKMRLTRQDVYAVVRELQRDGNFVVDKDKLKRR
jgi:hypothetical protein